jgi:hypothetical protein
MANADAYDHVRLDEDFDEPASNTTCASFFKSTKGYPAKRKVIDVEGRLGSLYDTSNDHLIDRYCAQTSRTKTPRKRFICRIFAGDQSNELINLLKNIDFDDAVRHSIRHRMVIPTGTGRLIEYKQPINQNTRFLYYRYKDRKEKLSVEAKKADQIVAPPLGPTEANYMITKIVWGIEVLCVIQIPNNQIVNDVDQFLQNIQHRLKNNQLPIQLDNDDRYLVNQLTNTTTFGSETCVDDPNISILTILTRIPEWQTNTNFHQPLVYTMQPLRWLYDNIQFQEPCNTSDLANPHIDRIEPMLKRIENQIKDLDEMFHKFPANFPSAILNQRLKDYQQHYRQLLDTQEDLQKRLEKVIPDVRRQRIKPKVLDGIIADLRYQCLHMNEMETFRANVGALLAKAILIEKLKNDGIEYVNAFDVHSNERMPMTNEAISVVLKRSYSNEHGLVILWYSGDRLKREQEDKWEEIYQQLTSERQQTTQLIKLVYVDFTQCPERLEKFVIIRLAENQGEHITGKSSDLKEGN